MSEREFSSAGLNKLSAEELAFLNAWLAQKTPGTATVAAPVSPGVDRTGLPAESSGSGDRVVSSVAGTFRGWTGNTEFRLANGQVWQQTGGSNLSVNMESPTVVIEKGMFNSWYLRVEGYNTRAKVKRLR